jgi:hypothetical protein
MKTITFFSSRSGIKKSSLIYYKTLILDKTTNKNITPMEKDPHNLA